MLDVVAIGGEIAEVVQFIETFRSQSVDLVIIAITTSSSRNSQIVGNIFDNGELVTSRYFITLFVPLYVFCSSSSQMCLANCTSSTVV